MLKALLKKQFLEIFQTYYYNRKTGKKRSKVSVVLFFVLFGFLIVGVLGGMFTVISVAICYTFFDIGLDWLYFAAMALLAVLFGCFGSVFNTYSSLYLAKDNDLLLSMPIPVKTIMTARLFAVYLLGLMYSGVVTVPAVIVSFFVGGVSFLSVIGGIFYVFLVSLFVLTLSCALGWVVAKISKKLKNKSFITVIISLLFFGAYYMFYFNAEKIIGNVIANAEVLGEGVKKYAFPLYICGKAAMGDLLCLGGVTVVVCGLFALTWYIISRSFLKITISAQQVERINGRGKVEKQKTPFFALYRKEMKRFTSSANYMLNSGFGIIFFVMCVVMLLIKKSDMTELLDSLEGYASLAGGVVALIFCFLSTMVMVVVPSVSLEGKNIWILQSMPVKPWACLKAKIAVQLVWVIPVAVISFALSLIAVPMDAASFIFGITDIVLFNIFIALFGMVLSLKMCNLNWVNETVPIKQGMNVLLYMLFGFVAIAIMTVTYIFLAPFIGWWYLLALALVLCGASLPIYFWLKGKGSELFSKLS